MTKTKLNFLSEALPSNPVLRKIAFRLAGLFIIFGIQMLLCRLMGMYQFGHYAVITTIVGLLVVFCTFGFDSVVQYYLPHYASDASLRKGLLRYSNRFVFTVAACTGVGVFFFLLTFSRRFNISFSEAFLWAILMLPFISLMKLSDHAYKRIRKGSVALPVTVVLPLVTLAGSLYYYRDNGKLPVDAVLFIAFFASIVLYFFYRSRLKKAMNVQEAEAQFEIQKWTKTGGQFFFADLLSYLIANAPILLLSYFSNNTQAGYFFITLKLSGFVAIAGGIISSTSVPQLYEEYKAKRKKQFLKGIRSGAFRILSVTLPAAFLLALSGKFILGLFHDKVANEIWLLIILIAAQVLNGLSVLNGKALTVTGKRNSYLILQLVTLTVLIVLSAILIPLYKLTGISIAVFCSSLFFYCGSAIRLRKK